MGGQFDRFVQQGFVFHHAVRLYAAGSGQDDFRLGIVDVPGHEKFVRQMLAGATGMDLALLVIAGDDSVKQQTREQNRSF